MKCSCYQQISLIKVLNSSEFEPLNTNYVVDLTVLKENFCLKYEASIKFPLIVNDITICDTIKQFQDHTANAIKHLNYICCFCSHFVNLAQLKHIFEKDPIIMAVINTTILYYHNFDRCRHDFESFNFCY